MKLQMNTQNLDCIFEQFRDITLPSHQQEKYHHMYAIPIQSGPGYLQRICLRNGMEINWFDGKLYEPVTFDIGVLYPYLEIAYTLEGRGCWEAAGQTRSYDLSTGVSTLLYIRDEKLHAELSPCERMLHMEIRIDIRYLSELLPEIPNLSYESFFCRQTAGSPHISLIVEQMKRCPYTGTLQKLYLEGKVFELLAYHLDGAAKEEERTQAASKLKAGDIRCLHQAKEILSRTWRQPPGLLELARLVGLNDYKLKLGFKELFGTTVFGYVRGLRMNEARKILEQGKANVSEVAIMVGYHNLSHFATLFRKTYGYNPSEIGKASIFATDQACNTKESVHRRNKPIFFYQKDNL
ncbi:AraC family transcriptional regulator [Aneurinibacillus aneurinilyticus]|uniref:AraC family transcriptional regulator n=1 Tax=Aneurinibacillus aneurinilyticus TaxID=1391 RepID=UPI002E22D2D8|nr:AraC family transcriptional regulator [Aneurinibacillus aneurinilyticus]